MFVTKLSERGKESVTINSECFPPLFLYVFSDAYVIECSVL